MTQKTRTFTIRHLHTNEELGVFIGHEAALAFCLENQLIPVAAPAAHKFVSPTPWPDSPTDFVMYVYSRGDNQ